MARTLTYLVLCNSRDALRYAEELARNKSDLNNTYLDVAISFPKGARKVKETSHRLGDYFDRIQVVPEPGKDAFQIVFQPRPDAGRYWKDLLVRIIKSVEEAGGSVSVESHS